MHSSSLPQRLLLHFYQPCTYLSYFRSSGTTTGKFSQMSSVRRRKILSMISSIIYESRNPSLLSFSGKYFASGKVFTYWTSLFLSLKTYTSKLQRETFSTSWWGTWKIWGIRGKRDPKVSCRILQAQRRNTLPPSTISWRERRSPKIFQAAWK